MNIKKVIWDLNIGDHNKRWYSRTVWPEDDPFSGTWKLCYDDIMKSTSIPRRIEEDEYLDTSKLI